MSVNNLNALEIERFGRQLIVPGWSWKKQQYLQEQTIAIEAPLSAAVLYAAAGGFGRILVIDQESKDYRALLAQARYLAPKTSVDLIQSTDDLNEDKLQAKIDLALSISDSKRISIAGNKKNRRLLAEMLEQQMRRNHAHIQYQIQATSLSFSEFQGAALVKSEEIMESGEYKENWWDIAGTASIAHYLSRLL